jgi:hypothetical protein
MHVSQPPTPDLLQRDEIDASSDKLVAMGGKGVL